MLFRGLGTKKRKGRREWVFLADDEEEVARSNLLVGVEDIYLTTNSIWSTVSVATAIANHNLSSALLGSVMSYNC
ncbi:MAG: hypothetical protein EAZ77_13785 [Nostocales cyanobacterium]|nr:MAG: hypothetical protein EAZ77_13785 [Nostocales cyanobacterium]